jgi:micrococcal nuclease
LVPPETLAAQTLAAMPRTATFTATATETPLPTATLDLRPPTPAINLSLPGAYCLPPEAPRTLVLVTKVLDSATIEVATGNESWKVKYIGLFPPRTVMPADWQAAPALGFNQMMVEGKNVVLVQDATDIDPEGYRPRYVLTDNAFVNYEVVRQGYASVVTTPPDETCRDSLIAAQVEAQAATRGIWQPTPPPTWTIAPSPTTSNTPGPATATSLAPCDCNLRYNCNFFGSQRQAQACYDYCLRNKYGPVLIDNNNNGLVCEGLP